MASSSENSISFKQREEREKDGECVNACVFEIVCVWSEQEMSEKLLMPYGQFRVGYRN